MLFELLSKAFLLASNLLLEEMLFIFKSLLANHFLKLPFKTNVILNEEEKYLNPQ